MQISPMKTNSYRVFDGHFSENEVLYLQNIFLTPGVHQIKVESIVGGRNMIDKFLTSLHYHQKAACLSLCDTPLPMHVTDMVHILLMDDYLVDADSLTLFFLNNFYFDFLWIEETQALLDSLWYEQFKQHLSDFKFDQTIPIIKIII